MTNYNVFNDQKHQQQKNMAPSNFGSVFYQRKLNQNLKLNNQKMSSSFSYADEPASSKEEVPKTQNVVHDKT